MNTVLSTYNMVNHATGLAGFIDEQVEYNSEHRDPIVYVTDEEGRHVIAAQFEEVILTDGSKVYNLVLKLEP
jgi:hypothetical protein